MIDPMTKLTEHFTLQEMCRSERHPGIYNVPPLDKVDNIKLVCEWLERLRALYGRRYNDGKDKCHHYYMLDHCVFRHHLDLRSLINLARVVYHNIFRIRHLSQ